MYLKRRLKAFTATFAIVLFAIFAVQTLEGCKRRTFNSEINKRTGDNISGAEDAILVEYKELTGVYEQLDAKSAGPKKGAGVTSKRWVFKILTLPMRMTRAAMYALGWSSPDPRDATAEEFKRAHQADPTAFKKEYVDRNKTTLKAEVKGNKVVTETLTSFFCRFLMGSGPNPRSLNCRKRQYIEYEMETQNDLQKKIKMTGLKGNVNLSGGILSPNLAAQIYGMEFKSVFEKEPTTGGEVAALELKPRLAHTGWDHDFILSQQGQEALSGVLSNEANFDIHQRLSPYMLDHSDVKSVLRQELKTALKEGKTKLDLRGLLFDDTKIEKLLSNSQDMSGDAVFKRTIVLNSVVGNAFDIGPAKNTYTATIGIDANSSAEQFEEELTKLTTAYKEAYQGAFDSAEEAAVKLKANSKFISALLKWFSHDSLDEIYQMRYYRVGGEIVTDSGELVQFTHDTQVRAFVPIGEEVDPITGFKRTIYEEINPKHLGDAANPLTVKCEVKVSDALMTKFRNMKSIEELSKGERIVYAFLKDLHEPSLMIDSGKGKNSPLMDALAKTLSRMFRKSPEGTVNLDKKYLESGEELTAETLRRLDAEFKSKELEKLTPEQIAANERTLEDFRRRSAETLPPNEKQLLDNERALFFAGLSRKEFKKLHDEEKTLANAFLAQLRKKNFDTLTVKEKEVLNRVKRSHIGARLLDFLNMVDFKKGLFRAAALDI